MKLSVLVLLFNVLAFGVTLTNIIPGEILYIHPSPNASEVPVQTAIILKFDPSLSDQLNTHCAEISAYGDKSGNHSGKIIISDNTLIFVPDSPFETSEQVTVFIRSDLFTSRKSFSFTFGTNAVSDFDPEVFKQFSDDKLTEANHTSSYGHAAGEPRVINGVTVPGDFPALNIAYSGQTAPGKIFIANWGGTSYMIIMENDGTPYFYNRFPGSNQTRDFKLQPTGTLTRRVYESLNAFVELDSQYVNIDTFRCKNGYGTDEHEIQLTADGHSLMIALDYRTVNMSQIVPGGQTNATVIGNHVQELDENHNVVFQWNSWDNFNIADAVHENLQASTIDYVHMNSIAVDYDSNIVISSRHLSEVTKINRKNGKIMWRLGGVRNQFTLINDTYGISYQHSAVPVPGKPNHYTVFDNGNFHSPSFSRVVEYRIDTLLKTATKIWEYRHSPDYYTGWMGNAQRLSNGNTFIDWADSPLPKAYEVTPGGARVYEANFVSSMPCYRAYRFEWESVSKAPYLVAESYTDRVRLIFNKFGDTNVTRYIIYGGLTPNSFTRIDSTSNTSIDLSNLQNNKRYYFRVTARLNDGSESFYSNEENVLVNIIQPGTNFIINGDFTNGSNNWIFNARNGAQAQGYVVSGEFAVFVTNAGTAYSDIQLVQESFPMINGKNYTFSFDARAASTRIMEPRVAQNGGNFTVYSKTGPVVVEATPKHFEYKFQMTDPTDYNARVVMNFGKSNVTCYVDNILVKENIASGTEPGASGTRGKFALLENFPNPFSSATTIEYELPEEGDVQIGIYNMMGERVSDLFSARQYAGKQEFHFSCGNLTSGVYLYRIEFKPISNFKSIVSAKKMLLLK